MRLSLAVGLILTAVNAVAGATQEARHEKAPPRPGVCGREAAAIIAEQPITVGKDVRAPTRVRDVRPAYPELPPQTVAKGLWVGEILISRDGAIVRVWTLREIDLRPPFPAFNRAIVTAVEQWRFEPVVIEGRRTPACMTVTVNINLR